MNDQTTKQHITTMKHIEWLHQQAIMMTHSTTKIGRIETQLRLAIYNLADSLKVELPPHLR